METINAEDVPLDTIINQLLNPRALRQLVGENGICCFALVRSAIAPDFFDKLIGSTSTIDATTRHHIAFIVFYGNRSNLLRPHPSGNKYYISRVEGLSTTIMYMHAQSVPNYNLKFSDDLTDSVRIGDDDRIKSRMAKASELAVSYLVDMFGIREEQLPCLLFIGSMDLKKHVIVPLDHENTAASVYSDVLAPLSDELRHIENIRHERHSLQRHAIDRVEAKRYIEYLSSKKASDLKRLSFLEAHRRYRDDSSDENTIILSRLIKEKEALVELSNIFSNARTMEQRINIILRSQNANEILLLNQQLRDAEDLKKKFYSSGRKSEISEESKKAAKLVNVLRGRLGTAVRAPFEQARRRLQEISPEIIVRSNSVAELDRQIAWIKEQVNDADKIERARRELLLIDEDQFIRNKRSNIDEMKSGFLLRGYSAASLDADGPSAFQAIEFLLRHSRIGKRRRNRVDNEMIKILFLAANPTQTTPLDLEEELRSIEIGLKASKFRDRISLIAKHAVRADDLVQYLRDEKPDIIHFSGHGSRKGIILRDDAGNSKPVRGESLARLFKDRNVKLVVLNSCYSEEQSHHIEGSVDTVVGTTDAVGDEAARRFSVAFYRTLGGGHSIDEAFRDGGDAVDIHDLEDVFLLKGNGAVILLD